jgi:hypothetical protein
MPPELTGDSESLVGFKLFDQPPADTLAAAIAVSVSLPAPPPKHTHDG